MFDNSIAITILVTIWLIFGIATTYIYGQKGRSEALGFLVGFLLGPLGVMLACVVPSDDKGMARKEKVLEYEKLSRGEVKKCPFCAELIRPEAQVCRYCGRDLPTNLAPAQK